MTPELRQVIVARWAEGYTVDRLAVDLALSRNSVMGVVSRAQRRGEAERRGPQGKTDMGIRTKRGPPRQDPLRLAADLGARPRACRWIEGDPKPVPRWCGEPVLEGSSYCAAHLARCYRPRQPA